MAAVPECSNSFREPLCVEKSLDIDKVAIDHVQRIQGDHDYIKSVSTESKRVENISSLDETVDGAIYTTCRQREQNAFLKDTMSDMESGKTEQVTNEEGIQASNLSSLLEQFLEYEQAVTKTTNLLTPATSPGHCAHWNDQVIVKEEMLHNATELTPPGTPPVVETSESKVFQVIHADSCPPKETEKMLSVNEKNTTAQRKRGNDESENDNNNCGSKHAKIFSPSSEGEIFDNSKTGLKEEKVTTNECGEQTTGQNVVLKKNKSKEACRDEHANTPGNIDALSRKLRANDMSKDEVCKEKRRRLRKRRYSLEESNESSDDERYDSRRSEQSSKNDRRMSSKNNDRYNRNKEHNREYGREKRHDGHRKYRRQSDDRSYREQNEDKKHRRHDDEKRWKCVRDIEQERKIDFRLGRSSIKDSAKEERRVVYVGGLPYGSTRDELRERLRRFGPIEKVSVHFRDGERDNYGFVTFFGPNDARRCIENGNDELNEPSLDLCFGGRRQYCGGSYVDFDSKTSHIEELTEAYGNVRAEIEEEDDFDTLLRQCQEELGQVDSPKL